VYIHQDQFWIFTTRSPQDFFGTCFSIQWLFDIFNFRKVLSKRALLCRLQLAEFCAVLALLDLAADFLFLPAFFEGNDSNDAANTSSTVSTKWN